jgi:hypothetical protein
MSDKKHPGWSKHVHKIRGVPWPMTGVSDVKALTGNRQTFALDV